MPQLAWIKLVAALAPAALTVRAQTVSPNNNGLLMWETYFPRVNVDSIKINEITSLDDRQVADRREWNGRGRRIPLVAPNLRDMEMVPIEAEDVIDEREMQLLMERSFGNLDIIKQVLGASIPDRSDRLAEACYRRLEVDAFTAWCKNRITVRNPQDASKTVTTSFGFDATRYQTAGTAWSNAGVNAYNELIAFMEDAEDAIGPVKGAMMRLATIKQIEEDAPALANGVRMTRVELQDHIEGKLGSAFEFIRNENSLDVFDDGGITKTRTKLWGANIIAAIPDGDEVGSSYFAPVVRAMELDGVVQGAGAAGIDIRGTTVYHVERNDGKEVAIQSQLNALPVPDEQRVFVLGTEPGALTAA